MTDLTIIFWRDIPAQVILGSGRKAVKCKLSEKYEKAIDRCAMKVGAKDSELYLKDWRKETTPLFKDEENAIHKEVAKLEKKYSNKKLQELVQNGGWSADIQHKEKEK